MTTAAPKQPKLITEDGKPVSHFSLSAVEHEANEEPFVFDIDGEFFTMAAPEDADWQITDSMSATNAGLRDFIRDLMSDDDWERFSKHRLTNRQITNLLTKCNEHYGTSPGESRASARSSKSTRRRSR